MKSNWIAFLSLAGVIGLAGIASAKPKTCDATAVAEVKAAIEAACPCDGKADASGTVVPWKNHGAYMKCITAAKKSSGQSHGVASQCLNEVVPCAAQSACGTSGAVACVVTTGVCLNDPIAGDGLAEGTCDNSSNPCDTNADCAQSSCQVASSTEDCTALGGTTAGLECCE